jgi:hypothetical protein
MINCGSSLSSAHKSRPSLCRLPAALCLALATLLVLTGCDRKSGVKASISQLEKAFPATTVPGQTDQPTPGQPPPADANAYVRFALVAVRSNDCAAAVLMLRGAARASGMTPEQFMAVDQAKKALITDLEYRAEKGDADAQAALKTIQ